MASILAETLQAILTIRLRRCFFRGVLWLFLSFCNFHRPLHLYKSGGTRFVPRSQLLFLRKAYLTNAYPPPAPPGCVCLPPTRKVYAASSLPQTPMGNYLEHRVRHLLTEAGEGAAAPSCHIREISCGKVSFVNKIDASLESLAPMISNRASDFAPQRGSVFPLVHPYPPFTGVNTWYFSCSSHAACMSCRVVKLHPPKMLLSINRNK